MSHAQSAAPTSASDFDIAATAEEAGARAAAMIIERVRARPGLVLGLATGATMEPVYRALVVAYRAGQVSFANVTSFNLDEYIGLPASHPSSYRATMQALFFDKVDIDPARTALPDGMAADPAAAAAAYEARIRAAGGIDLQLLGIGRNGHIGFNEPGTTFTRLTHVVDLHADTREANAAFFPDGEVPHQAMSMGIATILAAREIVVVATGSHKAAAVCAALTGPVSVDCPATALRNHGATRWFIDRSAAALLTCP